MESPNKKKENYFTPPLELWKPKSYVLHWLRTHNSADNSTNRSKDDTEKVSENDQAYYEILN